MQNNEEKIVSTPQSESSLDRPRYITFALITLIALFVRLNSLSVISSRQAHLANYETKMDGLEGTIAQLIFEDEGNKGKEALQDSNSSKIPKLKSKYVIVSNNIDDLNHHIAEGENWADLGYEIPFINFFRLLSSDYLLGLLLISCGIIGATISTLRAGFGRVSKTLILGASVGFIALLGVKGGTTIFTVSGSGIGVPLNPYSSALAGILAGMFSERLYIVLSDLIDKALRSRKSAEN